MTICGEEQEMLKVMDEILRIASERDNDRVLMGIISQVQENGEDFLRLDGMQ
jgi:RNA binding exosome subunit